MLFAFKLFFCFKPTFWMINVVVGSGGGGGGDDGGGN
jgi:hypothetical protein